MDPAFSGVVQFDVGVVGKNGLCCEARRVVDEPASAWLNWVDLPWEVYRFIEAGWGAMGNTRDPRALR